MVLIVCSPEAWGGFVGAQAPAHCVLGQLGVAMAEDVLPGLGGDEGEFIRCDADDRAVDSVKADHVSVECASDGGNVAKDWEGSP